MQVCQSQAKHLEGEFDGKGHEHDSSGLGVLHAAAAAAGGAQRGRAGASRPLAALAAEAREVLMIVHGSLCATQA